MKKILSCFAAIVGVVMLAASCSRGAESVMTVVNEGNGQPMAFVVEYNTPVSYLSVKRESYEINGYKVLSVMTSDKNPREVFEANAKKARPEVAPPSDGKVQVVPRPGQDLSGKPVPGGPGSPEMDAKKDQLKVKDGKYVLLLVRKDIHRKDPSKASQDSLITKPSVDPEKGPVTVCQVQDIKTAGGKTIKAWKKGIESSETIKVKALRAPGAPGGRRTIRRPGGLPSPKPAAPPQK